MTSEDSSNNPTWDEYPSEDTGYLADLKGVTFPSTAPDFSEDPRRGRHSSDEDALQATDPQMQSIFSVLNTPDHVMHVTENDLPQSIRDDERKRKEAAEKARAEAQAQAEAEREAQEAAAAEERARAAREAEAAREAQLEAERQRQKEAELEAARGQVRQQEQAREAALRQRQAEEQAAAQAAARAAQEEERRKRQLQAESPYPQKTTESGFLGNDTALQARQSYSQTAGTAPTSHTAAPAQAEHHSLFARPAKGQANADGQEHSPASNPATEQAEQAEQTRNTKMNRSFWHQRDARKVATADTDPRTAQTQAMPRVAAAPASPMSGMPRQAESIGLRQPAAPGAYGRPANPNPMPGESTMRIARPANPNQPTFIVPQANGKDGKPTSTKEQKERAALVAKTMREEYPDADEEFVTAIEQLVELKASDLHLVVGDHPMLRVDGKLQPAQHTSVWDKEHTLAATRVITTDEELSRFERDLELDVSFSIGELVRFRVNVYQDRSGVSIALRTIPLEIKDAQQLGLDPRIANLALLPRGLVLVCGPTGSGKSTTLAAIVDKANQERHDHIITIEDPIEFVHHHKNCIVSQREVGTDTLSFAEALKHALREDPDIIMVGELRDLETISTALTAVETGHLVFATLHTQDAASTVDRLIDVYPENQQQQIRVQVASTLQAVIVQTLLPRAEGRGRVPATEVMYATPAIAALIRGEKAYQIRSQLQSGADKGMHTLDQDLARLVNEGKVKYEDALTRVQVKEDFDKMTTH
ncbi:PilT/PilU family type 4a pilus ATPase [Bifidobacterium thermophilum]|uniref:type IV pilus twitching motility protein PilT n=1 Tax=Bifidobacterium thermophilum TaxID=33905 RepID=UPI0030B1DBA5